MNFYRDTWIEINLDAIYHNVSKIKEVYAKDKKMFAVVKADAYGHGAVMVARTALKAGADFLAVATLDEAIELRKNKIKAPLLVLGNIRVEDLELAGKYKLIITVHNLNWLRRVIEHYKGRKLRVHFKLDTGMHRIGFLTKEELTHAKELIDSCKKLKLTGIYTHMATSEEEDGLYFFMQQRKFINLIKDIDTTKLTIHLANSAATIKYTDRYTNAVRVGIMLYGLLPKHDMQIEFEPMQAIGLYGKLIHVKQLPKGSKISYSGIYETKDDEWIGTLAIGYADGWDRRMEDGQVFIDGHYCPIVGRICMDQTMVKLPYKMEEGTVVELIGPHIDVDTIAKRIHTINYQTVCLLSDRLPRIFKVNNEVVKVVNNRLRKLSKK